jgi:asparagine N-glycosylation enzyme membrane subunit Stt3
MRSTAWTLTQLTVLATAVGVRLSTPSAHFVEGRLIPVDADSAYHYRRALSFFEHPPWPSTFDPFLGFPEGAPVPWSPGWDAWLALCGGLASGFDPDRFGFEVGLAAAPLLVGALTALLAARTAGRWGLWPALAAGLFVALAPQHVAATQLGCLDHNAAEGLFLLALTAEVLRDRPRRVWIALLVAGAPLAWVGGLMYSALGMGALTLRELLRDRVDWRAAQGMVAGALVLLPPATAMGLATGTPFTYAYLSAFHGVALLGVALGGSWLLALRALPRHRRALLGGGLVALALALSGLGPSVWTGLNEWLLTEDPWLDTVTEMQPLFQGLDLARLDQVGLMLSWLVYLLPLALVRLLWVSWRQRDGALLGLAAVTGGMVALTLLQNRFGWTLAPVMAVALVGAARGLPLPGWSLLALVLLGNAHPVDELETAWVRPKTLQNRQPWTFSAYHWIRESTPPVDPDQPEYGVAGIWDHGHWLSALAERPEHIGHFGTYAGGVPRYLATQRMLHGGEDELVELMDRDRLRYLVLESTDVREGEPLHGLLLGGDLVTTRLRAVYASQGGPVGLRRPGAWVYERVQGARVSGRVEPGQALRVRIKAVFGPMAGRWRGEGVADEAGRFEIRVPYATQQRGVVATELAELVVDGQVVASFGIPEYAVREGGEVPVSWSLE